MKRPQIKVMPPTEPSWKTLGGCACVFLGMAALIGGVVGLIIGCALFVIKFLWGLI